MKVCSCAFQKQMIAQMLEMRRSNANTENRWVDFLFADTQEQSLCCILTFLFYYGYCRENTQSVSEMARSVLRPLMENE